MVRSHRLFIAGRALAGLSQSELAAEAGVAVSVVQAIEQNRSDPKLSTVLALLDVLKSHGVELIAETEHVAFGVMVVAGSEADGTGSIRPKGIQPPASQPAEEGKPQRGKPRASTPRPT